MILLDNNKLKYLGPQFPTYISTNSNTTPDIILGNSKIYHNYKIEQGPITASDHIPIIFTITTQAVKIPSTPRYKL